MKSDVAMSALYESVSSTREAEFARWPPLAGGRKGSPWDEDGLEICRAELLFSVSQPVKRQVTGDTES